MRIGARRAVVFSLPLDDTAGPGLSPGEQHVFVMLLCGLRVRDIATLRGTSVRTVGKQIEAVYRKLRVGSRAELAQRYSLNSFGHRAGPAKPRGTNDRRRAGARARR